MGYMINRRYSVRQEISGLGSSSRVFLVDDVSRGSRPCALKVLRPLKEKDLSGARREFETLRSLRHPLIAEVYDFGRIDEIDGIDGAEPERDEREAPAARPGDFFITFSYIEGLDLRSAYLLLFPEETEEAGSDRIPEMEEEKRWRTFYRAIAEIALGLHAIHSRGLVHHDIKPQNLLLIPRGPGKVPTSFAVKIIDLDLAEKETTPLGTRLRGTLPFVAPEVLSGQFADQRSDLYSLGISVIWAITGRSPFSGMIPEEVMRAIGAGQMSDLEELCPKAPAPFRDIVARMIRPESSERIPSAMALVSELERIGKFSNLALPQTPADIPTIGWERELSSIRREIEALSLGECERSAIFIQAESDSFVDQMMQEIEAAANLKGVIPITGRPRIPALSPYQPFSEIIQKIIQRIPIESSRYRHYREFLSRFVPGLGAEPTNPSSVSDLGLEKKRFFDRITQFLIEVGKEVPLLLCLRGLGQYDGDSLELVEFLIRNIALLQREPEEEALFASTGEIAADSHYGQSPAEQHSRLLIIAEYDEAGSPGETYVGPGGEKYPAGQRQTILSELTMQPRTQVIQLLSLEKERIAEWLSHRCLGFQPSVKLVQKIFEKCQGEPRLLDEIARRLCKSWPSGREEEELQTVLSLPENLQDAIQERLSQIGEADRFLLDLLAAAQAPLGIQILGRIEEALGGKHPPGESGNPLDSGKGEDISARLRRLVDEGFLTVFEGPEGFEAAWEVESLREHIYRQLDHQKRIHCHQLIFEALLPECDPPRPGTVPAALAFHAKRCGALTEFFRFAKAAADGYRHAYSVGPAIQLLEEVLESLDSAAGNVEDLSGKMSRDTLRWSLNRDLGEIHCQRRKFSRALEKYAVLLSLEEKGPDLLRRSEVYRRMGEIYSENRDSTNALFFLEKSLEIISQLPPAFEHLAALIALGEFHLPRGQFQRAETAAQRALDMLEKFDHPNLRIRIYSLLGRIAANRNDHSRSLTMNLQALEEAEGQADSAQALEIISNIGENYTALGDYEKAIEHFQHGIELAEEGGAKDATSFFFNQIGTIHFNRANDYRALEYFQKSLRLRRELGDQKGIANSYNNLGLVFRLRDNLTGAAECYKKAIDIFARIDDQFGMAAGMNNLANILELEGKYHEALEYSFRSLEKRKRFNFKPGMAFSYYRIGKIYQSKGELDKALSFAEKSLAIRREIGEKMGIAYSHVQIAELRLLSGKLLEAYNECQKGQEEFQKIENDLGRLVTRELLARILIQLGCIDEGSEILHETLARAREGNQQLIVGASLMGLGRIGLENGQFREAEVYLSRAEALFRENRNRREYAEALLELCALFLEQGQPERASEILEDTYTILEELGIRDLVPPYFLLRGWVESEMPAGSVERAKKFFERGLVEAREVHLSEARWKLHYRLSLLHSCSGEQDAALNHAREAEEILSDQFEPLPMKFKERFFRTRERGGLRKLSLELEAGTVAAGSETITGDLPPPSPPASKKRPVAEIVTLDKRLLKLHEVSQAITSELSLNRLLEKLMDAVLELVRAERGFVLITNPSKEKSNIMVARNMDRETVEKPESKISHSISQEVIRTGIPILSSSALADERFLNLKSVRGLRLQSVLCVPLYSNQEVLGAIYLDNRRRKHAFNEEDLQVLQTFSTQAAIAITNARLNEEIQKQNRELAQVNRQMEVLNQRLLQQVHERTSELKAAQDHLRRRQSELQSSGRFHGLVGRSKRMQEIFHIIDRISGTTLPVLIQGDSGTGKELIASAIHRSSPRHDQRFISENCAALAENILESELFGHIRGAFTGAVAERKGLFELAHGGTLFLDEVGDMSLAMQKKLLRVLEEGEVRRVGGKDTIQVDVRIISASNQDLKSLVNEEKFREDLYYRLNGIRINLPPLRDRKEDIPLLIQHFLELIAQESRQPVKSIGPEALRLLISYDWPGNVRELRHFLERTVLLSTGETIEERDCLFDPVIFQQESRAISNEILLDLEKLPLREARDVFMKHYIERIYEEHGRNVTKAARACGISRESLHRLLKKFKHSKK